MRNIKFILFLSNLVVFLLLTQKTFAIPAPGCTNDATVVQGCNPNNPSQGTCTRRGNCSSTLDWSCCAGGGGGGDGGGGGGGCDPNIWRAWSACSAACGGGTQTRTNACGTTQTQACNTETCSPPTLTPTMTPVPTPDVSIHDSSGYENHGTAIGTSKVEGKVGGGRKFDGVSDYIKIPDSASLKSHNFTVSAWFKLSSYDGHIIAKPYQPSTGNDSYVIWIRDTKKIAAHTASNNGNGYVSYANINLDEWYHVAYVKNGTKTYLYINGTKVDESSEVGETVNYENTPVYIGADDNDEDGQPDGLFNGVIDESRYYNRALSSAEVSEVYNLRQ